MGASGVFVVLYDEETLALYIREGIYGFLMRPVPDVVGKQSRHYQALADYACVRGGTHVFFFWKRKIYYGGQVVGAAEYAAVLLNGLTSPLGREAKAPLCWDESPRYIASDIRGVFRRRDDEDSKSQPYLMRFKDSLGHHGRYISSDQLYFELGKYGYPLPSNAIQGMSFCTLTPGEVKILLALFEKDAREYTPARISRPAVLSVEPVAFQPSLGIQDLAQAFRNSEFVNEAHLEFSVLANPLLLPAAIRPHAGDVICRQIPISPFKPTNMDRVDISYFSTDEICDGTVPNVIIELKDERAGQPAVKQIVRYLDWLYLVIGAEAASNIQAFLFAPSFAPRISVPKYADQIQLIEPEG